MRAAVGGPVDDGHAGVAPARQVGRGDVSPARPREEGVVAPGDARRPAHPSSPPVERVDRDVVGVVGARYARVNVGRSEGDAVESRRAVLLRPREGDDGLPRADPRGDAQRESAPPVGREQDALVGSHVDRVAVEERPRHIAPIAVGVLGGKGRPAVARKVERVVIGHEEAVGPGRVRRDGVGAAVGRVGRELCPRRPPVRALARHRRVIAVVDGVEDVRVGRELHLASLARAPDLAKVEEGPRGSPVGAAVEAAHVARQEGLRTLVGAEGGRVEGAATSGPARDPRRWLGLEREGRGEGESGSGDRPHHPGPHHHLGPDPQALTAVTW